MLRRVLAANRHSTWRTLAARSRQAAHLYPSDSEDIAKATAMPASAGNQICGRYFSSVQGTRLGAVPMPPPAQVRVTMTFTNPLSWDIFCSDGYPFGC
jgi:hypothetical protein